VLVYIYIPATITMPLREWTAADGIGYVVAYVFEQVVSYRLRKQTAAN
jgi:hypothetical protein